MADANSQILNTLLMETNSHNNDWGTQLNNNFSLIDRAAGFKTSTVVTTGGIVTLAQDQLVEFIQRISGALTSNAIIEVPAALQRSNLWINDTTGNFTMTIKVSGQLGITLLRGDTKVLRCNGTDVVDTGVPTYSQLAGIAEWLGPTAGTNDYTVPANEFIEVLADGLQVNCFVLNGNTSTSVTLNFNATGPKAVVHSDGTALGVGDLPANSLKTFTYHLNTDKWYMGEVSASVIAKASSTNNWTAGQNFFGPVTHVGSVIEAPTVLTDAATIAWNMAVTGRNVTVTLSADRAMGTPTNQVVGQWGHIEFVQPVGGGCNVTFPGEFDPMGTPRLDETASARTVFGYYVQTTNAIQLWPLYKTGKNSIGFYKEFDLGSFTSGVKTQVHGLAGYPALMQAYVECITANGGYAVGDRLLIGDLKDGENERGFNVGMNATNVFVRVGQNNPVLLTTSGTNTEMTKSSWKIVIRVYE